MSADLMRELASMGITTKEAAKVAGMSYYQFRMLRELYRDIKWPPTPARLAGLELGNNRKQAIKPRNPGLFIGRKQ